MANPLIRKYPKSVNKPLAHKSKGILDDYAVRKNVATKEGTIEKVPVEENDIVNKGYVDSVAGRGSLDLFLTENSSDIGTYFDLEVDIVTAAKENIVQAITGSSTTLIASFASILNNTTINDITLLESGIYNMHLHALGQTANNLFIYFEFYHRTVGGTETLLGTSHDSGELTTSEADYDLHAIISNEKAFISGDRIVVKVYGRNDGAANKNITIYMEGDTASRVEFPALLNVQTVLWNRVGTVLSPKTAGDNIETTGTGTFEGLTPYNNGTADLGSVGFKWRSLFLSSDATIGGNINITGTVDGIDIATDVAANTTHRGLTNPHIDWTNATENFKTTGTGEIDGMVISNDGTKTTFLGTSGDYNRIGDAGTTSHSLNSEDDLLITGELEVTGKSYFGNQIWSSTDLAIQAGSPIQFYESGVSSSIGMETTFDQLVWQMGDDHDMAITFGAYKYWERNYDHAIQSNPTIYIHSVTDPNSNNTQWISLTHDQTDGVIGIGTGVIKITDPQCVGDYHSNDGTAGFTGTGAYTNFTIKNGIITGAT